MASIPVSYEPDRLARFADAVRTHADLLGGEAVDAVHAARDVDFGGVGGHGAELAFVTDLQTRYHEAHAVTAADVQALARHVGLVSDAATAVHRVYRDATDTEEVGTGHVADAFRAAAGSVPDWPKGV